MNADPDIWRGPGITILPLVRIFSGSYPFEPPAGLDLKFIEQSAAQQNPILARRILTTTSRDPLLSPDLNPCLDHAPAPKPFLASPAGKTFEKISISNT